ncbi:hypothetical protein DYB36_009286 [Aphanomyces astaci]|uniref:Exocyst complex component Sec8 n=1 Tax=Aphanomyces astaci TaxID=112090 RepID=A0A397A0Z7_APHAT|nr:hypothetical protein DYB36_009286 [Aphanomyces astaci]
MKASEEIDRVFLDKKFSATKYMLRYIVGASEDVRKDQLQTIGRYRSLADQEIAGVVESNYSNFNASLGKFNVISNQLQEARAGLVEVSKRSMEGKAILTAKTKNLNELLLLKYESKKVIEVVDDIDFIDKAPSQIRHALGAKNATAAVDMYLRAFELVLSDKLAVFHAIASMRNALMECKQLIEDHIVHELESILFLQVCLKQTVPVFQTLLAEADVLYTTTNTVSPPASIIGAMNTSGRPDTWKASAPPTANPLAMLVTFDVSGTLKNTRRVQLDSVLTHVAALCQGKGYYEEATFGTHAASGNFETFVQVLAQVLEQLVRRHALLVECMDHGSCTLSDVLQSVFRLVQVRTLLLVNKLGRSRHLKICDGTLNQLETGVAASELMRTFQDSAVYLTAKGKVPHQPVAQVVPTTTCDHTEDAAPPGHSYGYSYALPTPILSTTSQPAATSTTSEMSSSSKTDQLQATEWEFEVKFKDPAFWTLPVTKRLLFDQGKLAMLAYINMACDAVSLHTEARIQSAAVAISADTLEDCITSQ